jgi:hypothetical protein
LRADLKARIETHRLTALLGPRRYGKTSVLRQITADLEDEGYGTVWIDLYGTGSMADLAGAFDRGLASTRGAVREALHSMAAGLSLRLGVLGLELSKGAKERPDPGLRLRALLQMLVSVAQRRKVVLVLDEFSGIANVEHGAAVLRTELQHHYRDLGIVFAGSQPSTMATLFGDQVQPFFSQADLVEIGPMDAADLVAIVSSGFERTGRHVGTVVDAIVSTSQGHPQRAMQLADAVWQQTPVGGRADVDTWNLAFDRVRSSVDSGSERLFAQLPLGHQKVLRIVATGGSVYGTAAQVIDLAAGTASAGVEALVGSADLVRDADGRLALVDPLLADWIGRRFPI